jgi:predicted RNA-binding Zn-ribbon protein involved in translation (DUF1610 family)
MTSPVEKTFFCSKCGNAATTILLLPAGVDRPAADATVVVEMPVGLPGGSAESSCLIVDGVTCQNQCRLDESSLPFVKRALEDGNSAALYAMDSEYVSSFCPQCGCHYCRKHWEQEVAYDDGFYDCTYGTCPDGHRRNSTTEFDRRGTVLL